MEKRMMNGIPNSVLSLLLLLACSAISRARQQHMPGEHASPSASTWKAVGKAVVGGMRDRAEPGKASARDDGPGTWYFSSEDVLGCDQAPPEGKEELELQFQLAHIEFDSRAQEPVTGVPDMIIRCQPAQKRPAKCHRENFADRDTTDGKKVTLALYDVLNPWEASAYSVQLFASNWINMESKRHATAEDLSQAIYCAGPTTVMIRGGHFAGAEFVELKGVRISPKSASRQAVARVPLTSNSQQSFTPPPVEPSPLLHGRNSVPEFEQRQRPRVAEIGDPGGLGGEGASQILREKCYAVGGLAAFATGTTGVLALAGESLLLASATAVRRFALLAQPVAIGEGGSEHPEQGLGALGTAHRVRLWHVLEEVLLLASERPRDEPGDLVHIDLHDFPEEEVRALLAALDAKLGAHTATADLLPSVTLPDAVRHAVMSRAAGSGGQRHGARRARRPVGRVGEIAASDGVAGARICLGKREGRAVWGRDVWDWRGSQAHEPAESWGSLLNYLENKGGWAEVLGAGVYVHGNWGSMREDGRVQGGSGFGEESLALWRARRKQKSAVMSESRASQLQQQLRRLLAAHEPEGQRNARASSTLTGSVAQEAVPVSELAGPTCALAVTEDGHLAVLADGRDLQLVPLNSVRHLVAREDGLMRVMGRRGDEDGGGGAVPGTAESVEEVNREEVVAEFSSGGLDVEELSQFFARAHEHQRRGKGVLRSGDELGAGGGAERKGRRLLEDGEASEVEESEGTAKTDRTRASGGLGNMWSERSAALEAEAMDDPAPSREAIGMMVARSFNKGVGGSKRGRTAGAAGQRSMVSPLKTQDGQPETRERRADGEDGSGDSKGGGGGRRTPEFVSERPRQTEADATPPFMRFSEAPESSDVALQDRATLWRRLARALLGVATVPETGGADVRNGDSQAEANAIRRIVASASTSRCLAAVATMHDAAKAEGDGDGSDRQDGGDGLMAVVCVEGGGVGVSGEDPEVVVPLRQVRSATVSKGEGGIAIYRLFGDSSKEGEGSDSRKRGDDGVVGQMLLEISEGRGFQEEDLLDFVNVVCDLASRNAPAPVELQVVGPGGEERQEEGSQRSGVGSEMLQDGVERKGGAGNLRRGMEDRFDLKGADTLEGQGEEEERHDGGFEEHGRPAEWVVKVVKAWGEGPGDKWAEQSFEGDVTTWVTLLVEGAHVAQVVGRGEALMMLPLGGGGGRLVWVNDTAVREVRLSELVDVAGNEEAGTVDIVVKERVLCSVSLEHLSPRALVDFFQHLEAYLRNAMQEQKDALALAETKRLAIGGHVSTGSDTMSVRGRGAPLFSVEVPASLRNKELVTFLQRKTVVDIFDQAHERRMMRRKWSQWQRILLRRISASPTGGDDDPVIVIVAGKRRMFAVTLQRIWWTIAVRAQEDAASALRAQSSKVGNAGRGTEDRKRTGADGEGEEVRVMQLQLDTVHAVQGGEDGHLYFRNASGATILHVAREELGPHEFMMLLDVISSSSSLTPSAKGLLSPLPPPTPVRTTLEASEEAVSGVSSRAQEGRGVRDVEVGGSEEEGQEEGQEMRLEQAVLASRLEQQVGDVRSLQAVVLSKSATLALGITRSHLYYVMANQTATRPAIHRVTRDLFSPLMRQGVPGAGGVLALDRVGDVRERGEARVEILQVSSSPKSGSEDAGAAATETLMSEEQAQVLLALDVGDFNVDDLRTFLGQLAAIMAPLRAEETARAAAEAANARVQEDEEFRRAPDAEGRALGVVDSRIRLLQIASAAILERVAWSSAQQAQHARDEMQTQRKPGPGHGGVGGAVQVEEETAALFDVVASQGTSAYLLQCTLSYLVKVEAVQGVWQDAKVEVVALREIARVSGVDGLLQMLAKDGVAALIVDPQPFEASAFATFIDRLNRYLETRQA